MCVWIERSHVPGSLGCKARNAQIKMQVEILQTPSPLGGLMHALNLNMAKTNPWFSQELGLPLSLF
jgi:hypothetical protein